MSWPDPELLKLCAYSRRLSLMVDVARQNMDRPDISEYLRTLHGLAQSVRIWMGVPIPGRSVWRDGWVPQSLHQAERMLCRPELMFDGNMVGRDRSRRSRIDAYQRILEHADRGYPGTVSGYDTRPSVVDEGLLRVVSRVERECEKRSVPIAAEVLYVPQEVQHVLWSAGLVRLPAEQCAHCYGRGVLFGHLAEPSFEGWCLTWLNEMVETCAQRERVDNLRPSAPGEFCLIDDDGVIVDQIGEFPRHVHMAERTFLGFPRVGEAVPAVVGRVSDDELSEEYDGS